MMKSQTLFFEDDTVEFLQNDILSARQYLIRLSGWNNYYDFRASDEELRNLAYTILSFIGDKNDQN